MAKLRFHFHRTNTLAALLIRWKTNSVFNHTSVELNGYFYDAKLGRPLKRLTMRTAGIKETVEFDISSIDLLIQIRAELESHVGKHYDLKAMFGFALGNNKQSKRNTYCSELTMIVLRILSGMPPHAYPELISPKDAYIAVITFHNSYKQHRYKEATCQQHHLP